MCDICLAEPCKLDAALEEMPASAPDKKNLHVPGAKDDDGKIRPGLVFRGFARALREVARVSTYGANKYTEGGWQSVPNAQVRYEDAKLRHELEAACGDLRDGESGLLHLAHAAWNALAVLELYLREHNEE